MPLRIVFIVIFSLCFTTVSVNGQGKSPLTADQLRRVYDEAQQYFYRKQYDKALEPLHRFINESVNDTNRRANAIDQVGRIYLREQRNPDAAIKFFDRLLEEARLTEAEEDDLSGWIAAAEDWKTVGQFPQMTHDPDRQFELGERFYVAGMSKAKSPMDDAGNADFAIAQSYLLEFIVHRDHDERIGKALYMMGEIRRRLWTLKSYWAENFYLKEVIRRYPHTPLAWKAYQAMEEDIHFAYTGSGGDHTPPSVLQMLRIYHDLAKPENPK